MKCDLGSFERALFDFRHNKIAVRKYICASLPRSSSSQTFDWHRVYRDWITSDIALPVLAHQVQNREVVGARPVLSELTQGSVSIRCAKRT